MLRVSNVGDGVDERVVSVLVEEAKRAFHFCADRPVEDLDQVLSPADLWSVMWDAAGKGGVDPERVSAAAVLTLIQDRRQVFKDYPNLPQPCLEASGGNFLSGFARRLAEGAAKRLITDWPDNGAASYQMLKVLTEIVEAAERGNFQWDNAEEQVLDALHEYRLPEAELWEKIIPPDEDDDVEVVVPPAPPVTDAEDVAPVPAPVTDDAPPTPTPGAQDVTPDSPQSSRRWRKLLAPIALVLVGATAAVATLLVRPSLAGLQDQGQSASNAAPVDRYVIPPLPPGDKQLYSPTALPNTTVRLFLMSDGLNPVAVDQTTNGVLPTVSAYPISTTTVNATFQVWLSVTDENRAVDQGLRMWINATAPMVIHDATLMVDPLIEGPLKPELNSRVERREGSDEPPLVNGGKAVTVEALPPSEDRAVIYQFQVRARPQDTSNDYPCGFSAASVQVAVQVGTDSRKAVTTPYPLYVPSGEDC